MGILKIPLATPGNFAKMMIQYQAWVNSDCNLTSNNNINWTTLGTPTRRKNFNILNNV